MSFRRKKSLGSDSVSTVSSSIADELVRENFPSTSKQNLNEVNLKSNLNNVKIDGSKAIQVGDIIYNFYTPPTAEGQQNYDFRNRDKSDSILTPDDPNIQINKSFINNRCDRVPKKYLIIIIAAAIFIISASIGVTFWVLNDNDSDNDNDPEKSTTEMSLNNVTEVTETSSFYDTSPEPTTTTESALLLPNDVMFFKRQHWNANSPLEDIKDLKLPIQRIIIAHTADVVESCSNISDCKARVKMIQTKNADLMDIPFNFLIGDDGNIYEGRGFHFEGEHTANVNATSYNDIGICVGFIGTFSTLELSAAQIKVFESFLSFFIDEGSISRDHKLFFQDQLAKPIIPAKALYETVSTWKNFHEVAKIHRRDEWKAKERCRSSGKLELPITHLILNHIIAQLCTDLTTCIEKVISEQYMAQISCRYNDIFFGFVIGSNGLVFEGRGFDVAGESLRAYDALSLGIAFIGNYNTEVPSEEMIAALFKFLDDSVALGKLSPVYKIHAVADLNTFSESPGKIFRPIIETWSRYSKTWD